MRSALTASLLILTFVVAVYSQPTSYGIKDPDAFRNFTQIVAAKGYPVEEHQVTTDDGYILGLFRIPGGYGSAPKPGVVKPPVLLFHGLLDCSFTWIINYPNQSLPYLLADAGYDVWMGNVRGNRYSLSHVTLNPDSEAFWDFSWDEHAALDLPNTVDYILQTTTSKTLTYVGHSQGTLIMFAGAQVAPQLASKVNLFVGLGPVIQVQDQGVWFLNVLADLHIDQLLARLGLHSFLPSEPFIAEILGAEFCQAQPILCETLIELLCGQHQGSFNESRMSVMAAHEPGGTSVKNIIHWAQMIRSAKWTKFDYGSVQLNLKHYNRTTPPPYSMAKFPPALPVALFSGAKDLLADPKDVSYLVDQIPKSQLIWFEELPTYAHLDFVWDTNAALDFYPKLEALIHQYNPSAYHQTARNRFLKRR